MPSARVSMGLTLHRSETIGHTAAGLERRARGSARTRRRNDGWQWETKYEPTETEKLEGVVQHQLAVARQQARAAQGASATGGERSQFDLGRAKADGASEWQRGPPESGDEDAAGGGADAEAETPQQRLLASLALGLGGPDLPRCQGRRYGADGFAVLRECIRESGLRVQQVKTDPSCGPDNDAAAESQRVESLLPARERYPPEPSPPTEGPPERKVFSRRPASRLSTSSVDPARQSMQSRETASSRPPNSARSSRTPQLPAVEPRPPLSAREGRGRRPVHQLPTLAQFVALGGLPLQPSRAEDLTRRSSSLSSPRSRVGSRVGSRVSLAEARRSSRQGRGEAARAKEGQPALGASSRAGAKAVAERWKKKERQLDRAEEEFFSRLRSAEAAEPDEKQRTSQDTVSGAVDESADAEAASPNRDVLGATPTDVAGGSSEAAKAGSDGGGPASPEGAEDGLDMTSHSSDGRRRSGPDEDLSLESKLRVDATTQAILRLRATLNRYQDVRDSKRGQLQQSLHTLEEKRPADIVRLYPPADGGGALQALLDPGREERIHRQTFWYRDLLGKVWSDKRNERPGNAIRFILEGVRQVLEFGREFRRETFSTMLARLEDFEITKPVAVVLVYMAQGVEGFAPQDLLSWYEDNRGAVPVPIREAVEVVDGSGAMVATTISEVPIEPAEASEIGDAGGPQRRTLTFVTATDDG